MAIQGNAGTGKTTLLKEIKILAQTSGKEIHNLAPSGSAAQTLAQETGSPSETLSAFLHRYDGVIHGRLTDKGMAKPAKHFTAHRCASEDPYSIIFYEFYRKLFCR